MARVSGTLMLIVVPTPTLESILREPLSFAMEVLTTSMPTPRPEMSVTTLLVEKPGAKMRLNASSSVMRCAVSSSMTPRLIATCLRTVGSIPAPSSEIVRRM